MLVKANVQVPSVTREYGVNSSNFRHWDDAIKAYVLDCTLGADGPRKEDFNTRWIGSLVADAFRILVRGGIYIYPADGRKGYTSGRLRLLYEANPIAMIMEQAGGACTTGTAADDGHRTFVPASARSRSSSAQRPKSMKWRTTTATLTPLAIILLSFRSAGSSAQW